MAGEGGGHDQKQEDEPSLPLMQAQTRKPHKAVLLVADRSATWAALPAPGSLL